MNKPLQSLRSAGHLIDHGLAGEARRAEMEAVGARYAIALTPEVAALIDPADAADPIARQFVPSSRELSVHPAERADPIGDHIRSPLPGLVHRYPDRVLLKIVGVCPVYCRFCFRREMVGPDSGRSMSEEEIDAALAYIHRHPEIWEVILTGGDPFMLSPRRVAALRAGLASIAHVGVLRWHTRVPVVDPGRVTPELIAALKSGPQTTVIGLHINHPRELTADALAAVARLADAGLPLVSQTVLLKGVNDDAATLEALMRALVRARVMPYYLHHGDLAPGTAHFRVSIARGLDLMAEVSVRLSGIARPEYVLDVPGAHGKIALTRSAVRAVGGHYEITSRDGRVLVYRDALPDPAVPLREPQALNRS